MSSSEMGPLPHSSNPHHGRALWPCVRGKMGTSETFVDIYKNRGDEKHPTDGVVPDS